ncbi:unnamed protein product [Didymodactylos carnosus]|uniref:Uncharacterized protein n=1 Tax=Didymodactylos carnosus TaxID=1234261 RepID=A0A814E5D5_9BILA|nr:unnamed protein product [Didymodactylos carnosus]CAF0964529.1 unnamed protein product [Didymodactylos carnosus]CAF3540923.1 unnamed protein product [Didymodactylos carnosus]CAF3738294.1 unnamed protein product [Didymodactylos carnosus]
MLNQDHDPQRQNSRPRFDPRYSYISPSITNCYHRKQLHTQNDSSQQQQQQHINKNEHMLSDFTSYKETAQNNRQDQLIPEHVFSWVNKNFVEKEKALLILNELKNESYECQKSNVFWRFSTTSLHPFGQSIPGMIDQSFEEVRWAFVICQNKDRIHFYEADYTKYWEDAEKRLLQLSQLDQTILDEIVG